MVGLFGDRDILVLLLYVFFAAVLLLYIELPVQDHYLKSCVLVEKDKAALLSGEASPDNVVQFIVRDKSVV